MGAGRRERMKKRIMNEGISTLTDCEILEVMLYPFVLRKDTVPIAKKLLDTFGSLYGVLHAPMEYLESVEYMPKQAAILFPQIVEIVKRMEASLTTEAEYIVTMPDAAKYLNSRIGSENVEEAMVIFTDMRGVVLGTKKIEVGITDKVVVEANTIAKMALNLNASGIIVGHNHPSTDVRPSVDDINSTKLLMAAMRPLNIELLDHIIVGRGKYCSLKQNYCISDDAQNIIGLGVYREGVIDGAEEADAAPKAVENDTAGGEECTSGNGEAVNDAAGGKACAKSGEDKGDKAGIALNTIRYYNYNITGQWGASKGNKQGTKRGGDGGAKGGKKS